MSRMRIAGLLLVAVALAGCKTRYIQTAVMPAEAGTSVKPTEAGTPGAPDTGTPPGHPEAGKPDVHAPPAKPCGATLASRLTVTPVDLPADVRYRRPGYNLIPEDDRVAFSISAIGTASIAWVEADADRVHVTSLDGSLARIGADVVVDGSDVGGVVTRPDGAMLLVTRKDPGVQLPDPAAPGTVGRAAVMVQIKNQVEFAAWPLTGTRSVVAGTVGAARDCIASPLNGRLEWNESVFGAYFAVHGCEGDAHASYYGDKLVYLDDMGRPQQGGWLWNCSINEGLRLLPGDPGMSFTPICLADAVPGQGLNLVVEGRQPVLLGLEYSAPGYTAGGLGSIVRLDDGSYALGWLSRGGQRTRTGVMAERAATDIAFVKLTPDRQFIDPAVKWLTNTPEIAELALHLAPYGPDKIFASWEEYGDLECNGLTCNGTYKGTRATLLDRDGRFMIVPPEFIEATPNGLEDIRLFPAPRPKDAPFERDLGFVYADVPNRDRAAFRPLPDGGVLAPRLSTLNVARLVYCR